MQILSAKQIKALDDFTIINEPISSLDLMERAASACAIRFAEIYSTAHPVHVFCGKGNNGGDGLAIARLLSQMNFEVKIYIIQYSENESEDFAFNRKRIPDNIPVLEIDNVSELDALTPESNAVVIDAILGTGISRPAEGLLAEVISKLNQFDIPVISIDLPSGMLADEFNARTDQMINASHTFTFQFPKLSFMLPENADCVGNLSVLDISLSKEFKAETNNFYISGDFAKQLVKRRSRASHKGTFGHALIIAGSYGKMGASILAGRAALRSGLGLLTMHVPACGYEIMQSSIPEAMSNVDSESKYWTDNIRIEKFNAIAVGPGLGTEKQTQNSLKLLIQNSHVPLVLDADALNIISENKTWLAFLPARSVLTPHPKEFERMTEKASSGFERIKLQRAFSIKNKVYVVLKGVHTSVSCPDGTIYFNSTGNPGMAKGGSGDALTGVIVSLLAQGYNSKEASILGVYLHGLAGDLAAIELSEEGIIPSDLISKLPSAFRLLKETGLH
ncbi:MAG: carbohydrate kinase, YjeF related protein [Bacteroidota bacterium]|nr:carbohydrate kinase, YjeF related protein [Bacteroidota bacterium]